MASRLASGEQLCGRRLFNPMPNATEITYIAWQNSAFRFYLAARLLYLHGQYAPAAFCGIQCIELLLKATLTYWDRSFDQKKAGHSIAGMIRAVRNKARNGRRVTVPEYYYREQRFYSVSRYLTPGKGVLVPSTFLSDLDAMFADLVSLVPFQFNSELLHALTGKSRKDLMVLRRKNLAMPKLRRVLSTRSRPARSAS